MSAAFTKSNLPIPLSQPVERPRAKAAFAKASDAHVGGEKRGLRGGQPVLDAARAAYLDAEWRGADDRRLPAGALKALSL